MSLWMFQVGLNVTVDETWVDVTSRHRYRAYLGHVTPEKKKNVNALCHFFLGI
jgi:hypothetical protein